MTDTHHRPPASGKQLFALALASIGVVFGDIGTSPIYALRESLDPSHGIGVSQESVLGILSLIFWSLIIVISIKYLTLVMKADNNGEGGIIALTALVSPPSREAKGRSKLLVLAGLFGAALLYGDSMITPAISVLSAIEGLEVATPVFAPYVIPITVVILVTLFAVQSRGTAGIGAVFGPIMLVWFTVLGVMGVSQIVNHPAVLIALSPHHAVTFFANHGMAGLLVLGTVFLVVTGGEALYADMGHFGTKPIKLTWFAVVLPCLMLNYLGQGALIIANPETAEHPFFLMVPSWGLYPLVGLTTVATVIASQAVISGAFSLTRQAVQLGYLPRLRIKHTSTEHIGQIYLPAVNWTLMIACIALVIGFASSSRLAAAYGVAVTTDMVFTTILFAIVAYARFKWKTGKVVFMVVALLIVDLAFWGANMPKIPHGGWFPLMIAGAMFTLMTTWKTGRKILWQRLYSRVLPIDLFVQDVKRSPPTRVPGTAIYMDSNPDGTPPALLHNLKHNKVLHERVLFFTIKNHEVPFIEKEDRVDVNDLGEGLYRVVVNYGFAEEADVPAILKEHEIGGQEFKLMHTSFFLGRERLISTAIPGMARWRENLFATMSRNAVGAVDYFKLPPERVIELGMQVEL